MLAFAKERALPIVIARLFDTVGPRQTSQYGMRLREIVRLTESRAPKSRKGILADAFSR